MKPRGVVLRTVVFGVLSILFSTVCPALAQPTPPTDSGDASLREYHVVGIYEGAIRTGDVIHGGRAAVTVDRPGKRVTLFLGSYDRATWFVTVQPETIVEKVILSGYHPQAVEGLPAGVEAVNYSYDANPGGYYLYIGYSLDSANFFMALPELNRLAGLEISSFHGQYQAPYPSPFLVDSVQDDPRLRSDYPPVTPPSELPNLSFEVAFHAGGGNVQRQAYTLAGPVGSLELLPAGSRLHPDATGAKLYGEEGEALVEIEVATGAVRTIPPSSNLPDVSWVMGAAFDTKRERALLVTLGGEGFLYGYAPAQAQWSVVSSMEQRDLACLVYHPTDDALYGVKVTHYEYGDPVIYKLSAEGQYLEEIRMPIMPFGVGMSSHRVELVALPENYLVVLLAPAVWEYPANALREARMYLVDLRTGQMWLTWKSREPANVPPSVAIVQPPAGTVLSMELPTSLVAEARDTDGQPRQVEFFVNGQSLGTGQEIVRDTDGAIRYRIEWTPGQVGAFELTARATDDDGAGAVSPAVPVTVQEAPPELPDLTVSIDFYSGPASAPSRVYALSYRTIEAPGAPQLALPRDMRVVTDVQKAKYYGTRQHDMWEVDAATGVARAMDLGMDVPQLSWPMGATYDPARERLLLVSLGGEGFLYAYRPVQQSWSVVASMDNRDLACLEYHAAEDVLYGLGGSAWPAGATLYRLSPDGQYLGEILLPSVLTTAGIGGARAELVSVDKYLVLLLGPSLWIDWDPPQETSMYVIDPATGRTWLAWRHQPHQNLPPSVQLTSPTAGTAFPEGQTISLFAQADDADGDVVQVEFFANGQSLGLGNRLILDSTEIDGPAGFQMDWVGASAGSYNLMAKATDDDRAAAVSPEVPIEVRAVDPPAPWIRRQLPPAYYPGSAFMVQLVAEPDASVSAYAAEDQPPAGWTVSEISHEGVWDAQHGKVKFGPFLDCDERILSYRVQPPADTTGTRTFAGWAAADGAAGVIGGDLAVEPAALHLPADQSPEDFSLTISEITAYAAAWKQERTWPTGPNPIPLSYVTRSGSLWRHGETYHFDPSAGPAPLWWVNGPLDNTSPPNVTVPMGGAGGEPSPSGSARRVIPAEFAAGADLDVTLQVEPAAGVSTYAVEERPPAGWRIAEASHAGSWVETTGVLRWGPFFDAQPRTLRYRLTSPPNGAVTVRFAGQASFDGSQEVVRGADVSRQTGAFPQLQITAIERVDSQHLRLRYAGIADQELTLETTTSLSAGNWTAVTNLPTTSLLGAEVVVPGADSAAATRFFRVRTRE